MKNKLHLLLIITSSTFLFWSCDLDGKRTTSIYGTITDLVTKQPVDSIQIIFSGLNFTNPTILKELYTNKDGKFEFLAEVSIKYSTVLVLIPFYPDTNPKFYKSYKGFKILENDEPTNKLLLWISRPKNQI